MKANQTYMLLATIILLLIVVGCGKDEVQQPTPQESLPITINATTMTKTLNTSTSFSEGSHMGIYVLTHIAGETPDSARFKNSLIGNYSNVGYTLTGTTWGPNQSPPQSTIIVPNPSKMITFDYYVYYPYSGDLIPSTVTSLDDPTAIKFALPSDQTLESTLTECDLMTAQQSTYDNTITLNFQRQCTLLQFIFTRGVNWNSGDIGNVTFIGISGDQLYCEGKMDIRGINGIAPQSASSKGKTIYRNCNVALPAGSYSSNVDYLIIPPTASGANNTDLVLSFRINYEGDDYEYRQAIPSKTFLAGNHYTYQVIIDHPANQITTLGLIVTVTPWTQRNWNTSFN